jgi:uncharacterized repeat protein (TIGR01451 family)
VDVAAQDQPAKLPSLQVVVLVDESGSIKEPDLVREKEAASTIASSVLDAGSVVSVVGFGSAEKPGQSAVDVVCQPTQLDAPQKRDSLAKCVGDLRKRADNEGAGTDHVAALQQALAFVGSGGPEKKVVFLLTDGKLDVSNSPSWGDTPARRNGAAAAKVKEVLADLDKAGAQVWPLGFGAVDINALGGFAKGKSCTPAAADPHERVIPSSTELRDAVQNAFSSASCVKYGPLATGSLPKGGSVDLSVDIPPVASDASIVVYKRDSRVQVEYRAPNASKPAPEAGGSHFEFAGQTTQTESLRITDPEPGRWTIHLSSADVPAQDVAATVAYQAAVKAYLTASPPQPAAGQTVDVNMQVWARGRAVTDPQTLQGLTFVTTLTGSTGFPPQQVTLADPDHDGMFAGQLKVPDNASGDLTYTGQVTGIGVSGDTRILSTKVRKSAAAVQAQILFGSNRATVTPGGTISGTVSVTNNSGQPARLRMKIDDLSSGTTLTVDPAIVQAAPGSTETPFTLRFGSNTPLGSSSATLRLVDDADPGVVVAERLLATEVAAEPGLLEKLLWLWILLAVVVAAVLVWLVLKWRSRNEASKARGLTAQLWQGGFLTSELATRDPNSKVFAFVVHDDFTGLQLQQAGPGEANVYEVRRAAQGISLTPPGQQPVLLAPGERRDIGRDLAIVIIDERKTAGGGAPPGPPADPFATSTMDPFSSSAGPAAPQASTAPTEMFAGSYGDPFAAPAAASEPTTSYLSAGAGPAGGSPFPADPFDADPFDNGRQGGSQHADPEWRSTAPAPDRDFYVDPNNPFA